MLTVLLCLRITHVAQASKPAGKLWTEGRQSCLSCCIKPSDHPQNGLGCPTDHENGPRHVSPRGAGCETSGKTQEVQLESVGTADGATPLSGLKICGAKEEKAGRYGRK